MRTATHKQVLVAWKRRSSLVSEGYSYRLRYNGQPVAD